MAQYEVGNFIQISNTYINLIDKNGIIRHRLNARTVVLSRTFLNELKIQQTQSTNWVILDFGTDTDASQAKQEFDQAVFTASICTGTQGFQGHIGPIGLTGSQGPIGIPGVQGMTGIGVQGPIGIAGLQGAKGDPGADGSSANIYNSNGALSDDRNIDANGKYLSIFNIPDFTVSSDTSSITVSNFGSGFSTILPGGSSTIGILDSLQFATTKDLLIRSNNSGTRNLAFDTSKLSVNHRLFAPDADGTISLTSLATNWASSGLTGVVLEGNPNTGSGYKMQLFADLNSNGLYYRSTNGSGTYAAYYKLWSTKDFLSSNIEEWNRLKTYTVPNGSFLNFPSSGVNILHSFPTTNTSNIVNMGYWYGNLAGYYSGMTNSRQDMAEGMRTAMKGEYGYYANYTDNRGQFFALNQATTTWYRFWSDADFAQTDVVKLKALWQPTISARYIRVEAFNGVGIPGTVPFVYFELSQLEVFSAGINVALGKSVTGTATNANGNPIDQIVNGSINNPYNYVAATNNGYILIDLGQSYPITDMSAYYGMYTGTVSCDIYYSNDSINFAKYANFSAVGTKQNISTQQMKSSVWDANNYIGSLPVYTNHTDADANVGVGYLYHLTGDRTVYRRY